MAKRGAWAVSYGAVAVLVAALSGCAGVERTPVPQEMLYSAEVVGFPGVRAWGGKFSPGFQAGLVQSARETRASNPKGWSDKEGYTNIIALSGGGSDGAFGAGVLYGWTKAGTRPTFKIVTGISTGSLIAPFAFLGPKYDEQLKIYTRVSTQDIMREKPILLSLIGSDSLADTTPLARLLEKYVTEDVLKDVAQAHREGRRLWLGTTNLDACRLVIWDMGAIASSGNPGALDLFRKVMRASAAIPVAFQPMYFNVEAGGKRYDEMHVDGGVSNEVFLYRNIVDLDAAYHELGFPGRVKARLYLVRNTKLHPDWAVVKPRVLSIAGRAVSGLISSQGVGDIYQVYTSCEHDGIDFNMAAIPQDFVQQETAEFDPKEMTRLFELGCRMAESGYPWHKKPPGMH